jgi:predicted HicB family RNase H-like nuclease
VPKSSENLNSNSLLKKFTYHVYSKNNFFQKLLEKTNRGSIFLFDDGENKEIEQNEEKNNKVFQRRIRKTKTQKFSTANMNLFNFGGRRGSVGKIKPLESQDLKVIQEYSPKKEPKIIETLTRTEFPSKRKYSKRITLRMEGQMMNKLVFNQRKKKKNSNLFFFELERKAKLKLDKQNELNDLEKIDADYLIRTPNDNEFSLELSDKRTMNGNRTYFYEYLNKLNAETKNEKVNTYKREIASQLLKFSDFYFDSKLDDFGHDKLFSEIKSSCDLFINKFKLDNYEEKKISDLDKFL